MISQFKADAAKIAAKIAEEERSSITNEEYFNILKELLSDAITGTKDMGWTQAQYITYAPSWSITINNEAMKKWMEYGPNNLTMLQTEEMLKELKRNRVEKIALTALLRALNMDVNTNRILFDASTDYMMFNKYIRNDHLNSDGYFDRRVLEEAWYGASTKTITKDNYIWAINKYVSHVEALEKRLVDLSSKINTIGLRNLYNKAPRVDTDAEVLDAFEALYELMPQNALTARTWGFELEVADAKGVQAVFGIEKGEDGSLRSYESNDDCNCDCDECRYHSCDCDNCESQNEDPDHCGGRHCANCDSAEFRSRRGIARSQHAGLETLCNKLIAANAEMNDTCGLHIHVYGKDLKPKQVAHVLAVYKYLEHIIAPIAMREDTDYAKSLNEVQIKAALKKERMPNVKQLAVNTIHLNTDRGTIEFRQMEGNLDYKLITVWAWFVRGLVSAAKRGMELKDMLHVTTVQGIVNVLAKFEHRINNESPGLLIPGGTNDNQLIEKYTYKVMDRYL